MTHDESRPPISSADKDDERVEAAQQGTPELRRLPKKKVAKMVKSRWQRLDKVIKRKQVELKVNFLRYQGNQLAQVHPRDPNRIYIPDTGGKRQPPALNFLRRSVHRYVAQVTADEPVMEAVPSTHSDKDRDAAEAATHALRGEWHRMNMNRELQRVVHIASIFRSGFWFFEWDNTAGGRVKAEKFFTDPDTNEKYLSFVDSDGDPVEDPEDAANIWQGNARVEVMTPMNVRWNGGRYAHEAKELMVGKLVRLRDLYETRPETREMKLEDLLAGVPRDAEKWLEDTRGENFRAGTDKDLDEELGDLGEGATGHELEDDSGLLDRPVFMMHYFVKESKTYPKGYHVITAGKKLLHRGPRRYNTMPIAHFKLVDEVNEPLGVSLIDMLKDPQELLDFVRGQILRHLQMMRRRWFLPQQSNVSARDLMNPDKTTITYNAKVDPPKAEDQPELAESFFSFLEKAEENFDDIFGIHETTQGKHVPGVSSGRHAEALSSGDMTLLGLTRTQIQNALEQSALVLLGMMKKEWTRERRVRYMGEGREYIDKAFSRTDFRETGDVRLKESTLLMLTKAQRLETIFAYGEMGVLTPQDIRMLAPLADTAGINLSEDEHMQRARRQNERFLDGPPEEAEDAFEDFRTEMDRLDSELETLSAKGLAQDESAVLALQQEAQQAEAKLEGVLSKFMPTHSISEDIPEVAQIHVEQHARALAQEKVDRMPDWWVERFEQHLQEDMQPLQPPPEEGAPPDGGEGGVGGGMGPGEIQNAANPGSLPAAGTG